MNALWLEIKYQNLILYSQFVADSRLFLSRSRNKVSGKIVEILLDERKNNLKSIVKSLAGEENSKFNKFPLNNFLRKLRPGIA